MFAKQFFGKTAWVTLAGIVALHVLAIPLLHAQVPSLFALVVLGVAIAVATWRSLATGMLIAFTEIMVGGHGHLVEAAVGSFHLSLRMVVFFGVMGVWVVLFARRRVTPSFLLFRDAPFLLLACAMLLGGVVGILRNGFGNAFDDMNGYFTIAYLLPLISVTWDNAKKRQLLEVLCASAAWIAVATLTLSFLFTHLPGKALHAVYQFVRDTRLAEVTLLTGPQWFVHTFLTSSAQWYFRVFEPAQFFVLVCGLLLIAARFVLWRGQRMPWQAQALLVLCVAAFAVSMSRSFVLGLFVGGLLVLVTTAFAFRRHAGELVQKSTFMLALFALGVVCFWMTIAFPYPAHPDLRDAAFYQEKTDTTRELAVSSRWNLLYPMFQTIMQHPVMGSGFGREVTYVSDDLRIRDINPTGEWTTYRFEWGYQDIWLKMGLLGLIAYIAYGVTIAQVFFYTYRTHEHRWIATGLCAGIAALFAAHAFSPYLNHPIGLGMMLFVIPFLDWKGTRDALSKVPTAPIYSQSILPRTAVVMQRKR